MVGLTETRVDSSEMLLGAIRHCGQLRVTGDNGVNETSSRSHAVLKLTCRERGRVRGRLNFIDLAGSERGKDQPMNFSKQDQKEGAEINKSLLALKECIRAIDRGQDRTPFRGSKLTMLLKESFQGASFTVMIGNISPGQSDTEITLNTLRYAARVKDMRKPDSRSKSRVDSFYKATPEKLSPQRPVR